MMKREYMLEGCLGRPTKKKRLLTDAYLKDVRQCFPMHSLQIEFGES